MPVKPVPGLAVQLFPKNVNAKEEEELQVLRAAGDRGAANKPDAVKMLDTHTQDKKQVHEKVVDKGGDGNNHAGPHNLLRLKEGGGL